MTRNTLNDIAGPLFLIAAFVIIQYTQPLYGIAFLLFCVAARALWDWKRLSGPVTSREFILFMGTLALAELIMFANSTYTPNSKGGIYTIAVIVTTCCFIALYFKSARSRRILVLLMGMVGSVIACWTIWNAYAVRSDLLASGIDNIMMFRREIDPVFYSPNLLSAYLLGLLSGGLYYALGKTRSSAIIGVLMAGVMLTGILLCFSRGAILAVVAMLLVAGVLTLAGGNSGMLWNLCKRFLQAFGLALLLVIPFRSEIFSTLAMDETVSQQRSTETRIRGYEVAIHCLEEYPVFGVGHDNFPLKYNTYNEHAADEGMFIRVQGLLIQVIAERGWFGILFFAFAALFVAYRVIRILRAKSQSEEDERLVVLMMAGLAGMLVRDLSVALLLFSGTLLLLFSTIAGLVLSSVLGQERHSNKQPGAGRLYTAAIILTGGLLLGYYTLHWYAARKSLQVRYMLMEGKYDKARLMLKRATIIEPNQAAHLIHRASIELYSANSGHAFDFGADPAEWQMAVGDETIRLLNLAGSMSPDDETITGALAFLRLNTGEWEEAARLAAIAGQKDSRIGIYFLFEAMALYELQRKNEALDAMSRTLYAEPTTWLSRYFHDLSARDSIFAISSLDRAISLLETEPYSPIISARLGALQFYQGNLTAARQSLESSLVELPGMNRPYYYLGEIAWAENDTTLAREYFDKSLLIDPEDALVLYRLDVLNGEQPATALAKAEEGAEINSGSPMPGFAPKQATFYDARIWHYAIIPEEFVRYITLSLNQVPGRYLR